MSTPFLKWTTPAGEDRQKDLTGDEITIGRLSESQVVLSNPYVSRQHAKLVPSADGYSLYDLKSTHGTFVNGQRITECELQDGDRITLGREQVALLYSTGETPSKSLPPDLGNPDLEKSMMQLTSVIPLAATESSNLEKISHILDFQYNWGKSFSAENTFRQILEAALKLSGAERGFVLLKEEPDFKYVVGMNGFGQLLSESEFRTSDSVVQEVATGGQPVIMTENIDQAFAQQQSILAMDLRAVACMPLKWISGQSEAMEVRGILYLDSTKTMHALTGLDQKILSKLAAEATNVFEKLELIEALEERKALEKELALAQETQETLLPHELPQVPGFEVTAFSRPTHRVGGDFYDFLQLESSSLTGVLADVSGKGISAALLSSLLQGALQMECRSGVPLPESITHVNGYLCRKSASNRFVTLFLFSLNSEGEGEYISAGHNPAFVYRYATGDIEELGAQNLVLGAFGSSTFQSTPLRMDAGDLLVVYSDGITEAENPQEEMFEEKRLVRLIKQYAPAGCEALEEAILEAIEEFTEGRAQTDDMTCMVVQKG